MALLLLTWLLGCWPGKPALHALASVPPCCCLTAYRSCHLPPCPCLPADEDPLRLLPCDSCDCQTHSYCLQPALEELPLATVRGGRAGGAETQRGPEKSWPMEQLEYALLWGEPLL